MCIWTIPICKSQPNLTGMSSRLQIVFDAVQCDYTIYDSCWSPRRVRLMVLHCVWCKCEKLRNKIWRDANVFLLVKCSFAIIIPLPIRWWGRGVYLIHLVRLLWNFNFRSHVHVLCGHGQKPIYFQRCHFQNDRHVGFFGKLRKHRQRNLLAAWLFMLAWIAQHLQYRYIMNHPFR